MKKIYILLFATSLAFGQDCKFDINKVDDFSKQKKIKTELAPITTHITSTIYFSFFKHQDTYLDLKFVTGGAKGLVVNNPLQLLLLNDEVISLPAAEIYGSDISDLGEFTNSVLFSRYKVSIDQLKKIRAIGLKKIKINFTQNAYEVEVKKQKWIDRLNRNIDCFIKACE